MFDVSVKAIFEIAPEGRTLAKRMPRDLAGKIEFFNDAHSKIEALKGNSEIARRIANVMEKTWQVPTSGFSQRSRIYRRSKHPQSEKNGFAR